MAAGVVNGTVGFVRKRLRDGTVAPLEERERFLWERAYKYQERVNARHNMQWLLNGGDWTDEQRAEVLAMLGVDDIDVDTTVPARLAGWQPGSAEAGPGEMAATGEVN